MTLVKTSALPHATLVNTSQNRILVNREASPNGTLVSTRMTLNGTLVNALMLVTPCHMVNTAEQAQRALLTGRHGAWGWQADPGGWLGPGRGISGAGGWVDGWMDERMWRWMDGGGVGWVDVRTCGRLW